MFIEGKTILHFDNEEKETLQIPFFLKSKGLKVIFASTVSTAVDLLNSSETDINLILMNIHLHAKTNVAELAEKFLKIKDIPILFITSHTAPEIIEKTESVISYGYFEIGSANSILLAMINNAFRLHETNNKLRMQITAHCERDKHFIKIFENMTSGPAFNKFISHSDILANKFSFTEPNQALHNNPELFSSKVERSTFRTILPEMDDSRIEPYYQSALSGTTSMTGIFLGQVNENSEVCKLSPLRNQTAPDFTSVSEINKKGSKFIYSFKMLEYFIRHLNIASAILDTELRYLYVSGKYLEENNIKEGEIIGRHYFEVCPDNPGKWAKMFKFALNGIAGSSMNEVAPDSDSTHKSAKWDCQPWYEENGSVGGIILCSEPSSELNRIPDDLLRYKAFFNQAKWGIAAGCSRNFSIELCNTEFANMHGYTIDEIKSMSIIELVSPEERPHIFKILTFSKEKGHVSFESVNIRKDGSRFPVQIDSAFIPAEPGLPAYRIINVIDISEKISMGIQFQENQPVFASVFSRAGTGMAILDSEYKYLNINNAFCKMTGYSEKELLGKSPVEITHPEDLDKTHSYIENMNRNDGESQIIEKRYLKKNGEILWVIVNSSIIWNSDGTPSYFIAQIQDITERKYAEQKLEESNAEKENFLSIIAHDLRGPLSSFVALTSEMLKNQCVFSKDEMYEYINVMYKSSSRTLSILLNLLDWASLKRENTGKNFEPVYLMETVEKTAGLFSEIIKNKSIFLIFRVEQDAVLHTNKKVLETVLRNLISNAVKYSKVNGSINIISDISDNKIKLIVKDNGIGMDEKTLKMISSGHSVKSQQGTKKEHGSGLGLALCHELLDTYEGTLSIESKLGEGATFSFTLPCSEK